MKKRMIFLTMALFVLLGFFLNTQLSAATKTVEGGVTIEVPRILHSENGQEFLGPNRGTVTLPNDKGGMFAFRLYNDMRMTDFAITNYFNADVGPFKIRIPYYTTRNQIQFKYKEFNGEWGAAGVSVFVISVPEGVSSFQFNNAGSVSGIEITTISFYPGRFLFPNGYKRDLVAPSGYGAPVVQAARTLTGAKTGTLFYGYNSAIIHLPHMEGGHLSFRFFNDQNKKESGNLNAINLKVGKGGRKFTQYTTSMDLKEFYKEFPNEWGPAGGSRIIIQVPEDISRVELNRTGGVSGVEISDIAFTKGTPLVFDYKEAINTHTAVIPVFPRVLHGARSGILFYGYNGGKVILPHDKGGVLSFSLYNDHQINAAEVKNKLLINDGKLGSPEVISKKNQRQEFYTEWPNEYGPAGGKPVEVRIPKGMTEVTFKRKGGNYGIELSHFQFRGDPCLGQ